MVVWLDGDLGAGKTTLVRAVLRAFGHAGPVKSPTYTLVEVYVVSSIYLYHFDFYRFNEAEEFEDAGLGEYFRDDSRCVWSSGPKKRLVMFRNPISNLFSVSRLTDGRRRCRANS
jgi:tRNA threonylcarbamoyl adenosine modification protein YjeE